jgi:hypothetical protein
VLVELRDLALPLACTLLLHVATLVARLAPATKGKQQGKHKKRS